MADVTITPAGQGGTYAHLQDAIAAQAAAHPDLTAYETINFKISGDWSAVHDTTAVTITGFTCDATHYVNIITEGTARNTNAAWDDTKYVLEIAGGHSLYFTLYPCFFRLDGIQISNITDDGNFCIRENVRTGDLGYIQMKNCWMKRSPDCANIINAGGYGPPIWDFVNCILVENSAGNPARTACNFNTINGHTINFYNCTFANAIIAINQQAGTVKAVNCGFASCTALHGGTVDHTGNCSEITPTFVSGTPIASLDFHLNADDTTWLGQGTSTPGSATAYTDDIEGDTRPAAWSIGADDIPATGGGGGIMKQATNYYRRLRTS